jgi:hypothetical protein
MTTISVTHGARSGRTATTGFNSSALTRPVLRLTRFIQTEITRRRTERMLEGLPFDIRKDIGWPAPDQQKAPSSAPRR